MSVNDMLIIVGVLIMGFGVMGIGGFFDGDHHSGRVGSVWLALGTTLFIIGIAL